MPEQKKNEMTDSDRFKSLYFDSSQENLLLKGGRLQWVNVWMSNSKEYGTRMVKLDVDSEIK